MAKGTRDALMIKIAIGFDPVMFEQLNAEAKRRRVGFAQIVRDLVALGTLWREFAEVRTEPTREVLHLAGNSTKDPQPIAPLQDT